MQQLKYFLLFLLCIPVFSNAQDKNTTALVGNYLEVNGSMGQYNFAYDELLKMLKGRYPENNSNAEGWKYLKENKTKAVGEMKTLLIPIYETNFTKEDISKMVSFYTSATGKQLLTDRSKMNPAQKEKLNTFYNSEVGKKIIEKQSILGTEISKASEGWSRDLYETALSLLK
ncbi:hypothetical protein CLV91_2590 [Maribacter vaceletii]|uniref:DUF2059 domain-containing protein n=1 Tax=Maribacter vaceletii TaxID=1206816 RepID=A0A495E7A6_9FLAO|nr:DUF2059 domain-containing protein [Maribacter vaceletii]RKR12459.1 hypothetical protein CLV91_2590 [Maribacter vaceletii]